MSPTLQRKENKHFHEALLGLCKNMNLDIKQLTHNSDCVAAKEHMEKGLEDFGMLFNRKEMFADLVLIVPRQESSTAVGSGYTARRMRSKMNIDGGGEEGFIYCHRAILAARCKVFGALFLRWETSDDEEGNDKESGGEKDSAATVDAPGEESGGMGEEEDELKEKRKKKECTNCKTKTKKKKAGAKDLKKKRKRDGTPELKHIRRKKDAQNDGTVDLCILVSWLIAVLTLLGVMVNSAVLGKGELPQMVVRDVDYDTVYKIVEFIYKGRVELDESCVVDVLRAADIYGLDALKFKCEAFLGDSLDLDNIATLLEIANIYSAWHLEKRYPHVSWWRFAVI
jgi:hypothetical protein